jgi:ribosomal protein L29
MANVKKNTKGSFKEMKSEELKKELALLRENLRTIHFKVEGSRSKNVKEAANLKKQIARILTELNVKKDLK